MMNYKKKKQFLYIIQYFPYNTYYEAVPLENWYGTHIQ